VLIFGNLILDGYTNNQQDAVFTRHKVSSLVMMKYTNMWQILWLGGFLVLSYLVGWGGEGGSELSRASLVLLHYEGAFTDLVLFCVCACAGQLCVFRLMQEYGSLVWICVSVVRKLFTVLLSVIMFNHTISAPQWAGLALTFSGILLDAGMSVRAAQAEVEEKVCEVDTPKIPADVEEPEGEGVDVGLRQRKRAKSATGPKSPAPGPKSATKKPTSEHSPAKARSKSPASGPKSATKKPTPDNSPAKARSKSPASGPKSATKSVDTGKPRVGARRASSRIRSASSVSK